MEDPGTSSGDDRDGRLDGLVRPYVLGSGDNRDTPPDDPAGSGPVSLPNADEVGLSGLFEAVFPPEQDTARPADVPAGRHLLARVATADPRTWLRAPAGRRRSAAIAAAAGLAAVAIGVVLLLPDHSATVLASRCQSGGCNRVVPPVPATVLPVAVPPDAGAHPSAFPAASRAAAHPSATRSATARASATTSATAAPSVTAAATPGATGPASPPTAAAPGLTPGSRISVQATTACCTSFYIGHDDGDNRVVITQITSGSPAITKADATWIVRSGLADSSCISFESADGPGRYLRHSGFELYLDPDDGSPLFAHDATFCPQPGNGGRAVSFESVNYPDKYIRHYDYVVYIASDGGWNPWDTPALWPDDTTWLVSRPWG